MDIERMREEIMNEYPGARWKQRVLGMPDYQIFAIYRRVDAKKDGTRKKRRKKQADGVQLRFDI